VQVPERKTKQQVQSSRVSVGTTDTGVDKRCCGFVRPAAQFLSWKPGVYFVFVLVYYNCHTANTPITSGTHTNGAQ